MKNVISLLLSFVMLFSITIGVDLSAYADEINEQTVESILFTPAKSTYIENFGGYWYTNDDEKYYNYSVYHSFRSIGSVLTVKYKDLSIENYIYGYNDVDQHYGYYNENGKSLTGSELQIIDEQENFHWIKDGKYNYYTIEYLGAICQVPITIVDDITVSSIRAKQIKCADNSLSYWDLAEKEYFEYIITYSDGSVEKLTKFLSDGFGFNEISGFFGEGKYIFGLFLRFENTKSLVGTKLRILYDFENVQNEVLISNHIGVNAYKSTVTKATPTADGKIVYTCSVCKKTTSTTVIPKASNIKLSATSYTYDGKVKTPNVTVKDSKGKTLRKNTDYTVSYASGRKNVGKYAVKITFKGNYTGSKTLYFTINPKGTSLSKVTAAKKGFKVYWKKQSTQTTGYQIQYATNSKFSKAKTITLSKNSYTSKSISKLSAKKKYYVRIRTYKKIGSATYYSSWSKAKSVTTKK